MPIANQVELLQVNCLGNGYWHFFLMNDGTWQIQSCSQSDYEALALPNPTNPTITNGTWVKSIQGYVFDTPDYGLPINSYSVVDGTLVWINQEGEGAISATPAEVSNNIYTPTSVSS